MLNISTGIYNLLNPNKPSAENYIQASEIDTACYKFRTGFFVGFARANLGLIQTALTAIHAFGEVIQGKKVNWAETRTVCLNGLEHFGKGVLAMIPIIGGIALDAMDRKRAGAVSLEWKPVLSYV